MPATQLRLTGYFKAHDKHRIPVDQKLIQAGVFRDESDELCELETVLRNIMSLANRPSAIMCGNDKMAMRVYMLIRGVMGYKFPEQISIVGYDNYHLIADNLVPKLSTVALPYFKMGQLAAELAIHGQPESKIHKVSSEYIPRHSTQKLNT